MLMDMNLPKCDIYQVQTLQIVLRAMQTLDVLTVFKKSFVWYSI